MLKNLKKKTMKKHQQQLQQTVITHNLCAFPNQTHKHLHLHKIRKNNIRTHTSTFVIVTCSSVIQRIPSNLYAKTHLKTTKKSNGTSNKAPEHQTKNTNDNIKIKIILPLACIPPNSQINRHCRHFSLLSLSLSFACSDLPCTRYPACVCFDGFKQIFKYDMTFIFISFIHSSEWHVCDGFNT